MSATVVIPYSFETTRQHAFEIVDGFWQQTGLPVVVTAVGSGETYNCGPAKNVGVQQAATDVVVIADADTIAPPSQIAEAVWLAREPGLVFCATRMRCLSSVETMGVRSWRDAFALKGDGGRDTDSMSGLLAIRRDCFWQTGGFDESYVGYGFEDLAFHRECARLWPHRWVEGEAVHLWHRPAQQKLTRGALFEANERRWLSGQAPPSGS